MSAAVPGRDAPPRLESLDRERREYKIEIPKRFNAVTSVLGGWALEDPNAPALVSVAADGKEPCRQSALDLVSEADRMAAALLSLGIGPGEVVLVMLPRVPAWYTAVLGAIRLGAVAAPTPNLSTPRDLGYRLEASAAVAVITDAAGAEKVDAIEAELPALRQRIRVADDGGPVAGWLDLATLLERVPEGDAGLDPDPTDRDDPMLLFFTSGTVGRPKMIDHAQTYALGHVATARFWHDLRPGDLHWTVSDTGWAKAAWGSLFGQWHERATVFQAAIDKPTPEAILGAIATHGVTSFCAPPTLYRSLVQADLRQWDLSVLRHCTSAGEPLNPEVIRAWSEGTGLTVYDGYGQTESTLLVGNFRTLEVRPGSMGKPVPGYDVAILDENGEQAQVGQIGSIAVSISPRYPVGLFRGYSGDHRDPSPFADGWYHTGDTGSMDADGYLWFDGRADDVITSSAYRIGPFEVESALVEHPAVMEAAVVGRPDLRRTQIVVALVILAPGVKASDELVVDLQNHVKEATAPYKYPREIKFVDALPKTVSGKIKRSEIRAQMKEGKL